jgi:hypothetical protein
MEHVPKTMMSRCFGSADKLLGAACVCQSSCSRKDTHSFTLCSRVLEPDIVSSRFANSDSVEASNNAVEHGKSPVISAIVINGGPLKNTVFMQSYRKIHVTNLSV